MIDKHDEIDKEWEMYRGTFQGRLEALSVSMQLFCEQAKDKGFDVGVVEGGD